MTESKKGRPWTPEYTDDMVQKIYNAASNLKNLSESIQRSLKKTSSLIREGAGERAEKCLCHVTNDLCDFRTILLVVPSYIYNGNIKKDINVYTDRLGRLLKRLVSIVQHKSTEVTADFFDTELLPLIREYDIINAPLLEALPQRAN